MTVVYYISHVAKRLVKRFVIVVCGIYTQMQEVDSFGAKHQILRHKQVWLALQTETTLGFRDFIAHVAKRLLKRFVTVACGIFIVVKHTHIQEVDSFGPKHHLRHKPVSGWHYRQRRL